ncbi:MAG TPA: heparinase II/III family protein, partial [Usitatibacter sp.]|nr:heparinase II/III family protein [Usitatibacter sp.]
IAQAIWSASGPVGYANNDMASRTVAWTLALGYDWMHDYLSESQKGAIRAAIRARTRPMFEDILPRLSNYPYDSHGNVTLGVVAAIGALMAGELPEADRWVKEAIAPAVVWTSPWGWQDGGFGNGTAQAFWDTGSNLVAWNILKNAAGVDLPKKEWIRNNARFMAYFVPPGTPAGNFGDGEELHMPELWARVAKALAQFAPTPIARWYARQLSREDDSRLEILLAPHVDLGPGPYPPDTPNAAFFPSVGWVAMHSNLADPLRTSVYFKSSAYGSYNHSHGDQNSFVVNHKGKRLAIASGYYDDYGSAHWNHWYKQTRASNAITFDGGLGQGFNEKRFSGEITRFESNASYDYAIGHAEKAYGEALSRAQRSIVYLHPNAILVYDSLASATARTWEWNIHAINRIDKISDKKIHIKNGAAQMCVELLASPEVAFSQIDLFTVAPAGANLPKQWHGTFASLAKSERAEFIALMRVGSDCSTDKGAPSARAAQSADGWQVTIDGATVSFTGESVSRR